MTMDVVACPVCLVGRSILHAVITDYPYYACTACGSIHVAPNILAGMDAGTTILGE